MRAHRRADVAHRFGAHLHRQRRGSEFLPETDPVEGCIGFGQFREAPALRPVELATIDDNAANGNAVTAHPLGDRMHDDIGAMIDRSAQARRRKGRIDHQRNSGLVRDRANPRDIGDFEPRVTDRFTKYHLGIRLDCIA